MLQATWLHFECKHRDRPAPHLRIPPRRHRLGTYFWNKLPTYKLVKSVRDTWAHGCITILSGKPGLIKLPSVPGQGRDATPLPDLSEEEDRWPFSGSFQHRYMSSKNLVCLSRNRRQRALAGSISAVDVANSSCCPSAYQLVHLDPALPFASVASTVLDSAV